MIAAGSTKEPAPEGRRSRRRRELHDHIRHTAAELFRRHGFEATTVETIAEAADIVPATFFNHFPTKEDVLREIGAEVFGRFHGLIEEQMARPVPTVERLRGFGRRSAALVQRAPDLTRRVLLAVLRTSSPSDSRGELAAMHEDMRALLADGRRRGDVAADLDEDLAAEILVAAVTGAMTRWMNDPDYPLAERLPATAALLGERLLAPSGFIPSTDEERP
jgi:AcrR family transcriptional regulator